MTKPAQASCYETIIHLGGLD